MTSIYLYFTDQPYVYYNSTVAHHNEVSVKLFYIITRKYGNYCKNYLININRHGNRIFYINLSYKIYLINIHMYIYSKIILNLYNYYIERKY